MSDLDPARLATISRMFSSSVIREMARRGKSPLFTRLVSESRLSTSISRSQRVSAVFDAAFSLLKREGCRDEYIYKTALTHNILLGKHSLNTASMLNEFRVGECKADIAILNGTSTVYEVKSERDSLVRLEKQIAAYSRVFAQVYVIGADNHADSVARLTPSDVGILRLNSRQQITTVREAADRPDWTSPVAIFECVRTDEARLILQRLGVPIPVVPNTKLSAALGELFIQLDARKTHDAMVQVLKKTRNLLPLSDLVAHLPRSLHSAALSVPLRRSDHARLVAAVNTPLETAMAWT